MKTPKPRNHVHLALLKGGGAGSHKKATSSFVVIGSAHGIEALR